MRKVASRLLIAAAILYFAIAAYGRHHQRPHGEGWDYVCPCTECDCGPPMVKGDSHAG